MPHELAHVETVADLRTETEAFLAEAETITAGDPALRQLHDAVEDAQRRLQEPMRVAVVGRIKAGKSTFVNALLGEQLVATGQTELTFNVNWLRFAEAERAVVHFKDSRPSETHPIDRLDEFTRRRDDHKERLRQIAHVEVFYPNPLLRAFDLIDTPGLESSHQDDAQNTLDFLGIRAADVEEATEREAVGAHAILFLFSHAASAGDAQIAGELQKDRFGYTDPIASVGVLTRIDAFWSRQPPGQREDPLAVGRRAAEAEMTDPEVRALFSGVFPIAGKLALGAQTITETEYGALRSLSELPDPERDRLFLSAKGFVTREVEGIPSEHRAALFERLDLYGCDLAVRLLRGGDVSSLSGLKDALLNRTGLPELRSVLAERFGARAHLVKLADVIGRLIAACRPLRALTGVDHRRVVNAVEARIERLSEAHPFQEDRVLRLHYTGKINLPEDEVAHLLEVTGERGHTIADRLGVDTPSGSVEETLDVYAARAQDRIAHWQRRASGDFLSTREAARAARVVLRSYERLLGRLTRARDLLRL